MVINIDPKKLAELILKVFPSGIESKLEATSVHLAYRQPEILDAAIRLLVLLSQPADLKLISPLIMEEILIRLLHSPIGSALAQVGKSSANLNKIIKAISHIRENVLQTITVDGLSKTANMSQSSFHQHFKAITLVSPLQFQKILRLQQAKHLILSKGGDVGSASAQVGYASISQFSREYNRFFGNPPSKDISN